MLGIRQKLSIGFAGLLGVILLIGSQSIQLFSQLGNSIDVILRENYRSVIACQEMKEALERMDSGLLFVLLGYNREGMSLIEENKVKFEAALEVELNNITLPGEGEKAKDLDRNFRTYKALMDIIVQQDISPETRRTAYFEEALVWFQQIKSNAETILELNQQNMTDANNQARHMASSAQNQMYLLVIIGFIISVLYILLIGKWILTPITRLRNSANEIARGNLDLVIDGDATDEIGQLSRSFNTMAQSLRRVRRTREAKISSIRKTMEEALGFCPRLLRLSIYRVE